MSTLVIVISIAVLLFGSIADLKKKLATQQPNVDVDEEECEECTATIEDDLSEVTPKVTSEDYYYIMNDDKPVKSEKTQKSKKVHVDPKTTTVASVEEDEPSLNFDLRQAVINQAILQNDYVDNLK